jgi:hypothetical protein
VGMGAEEMAHANWRLDNPPVVDVAVSRRMGLFVVARLAARHGIRVRLRPAASGGLIALVWLPDEAITHAVLGTAAGPGDSDLAMAISETVAGPAAEGGVAAGSRRGTGWATTGSPPSFRTVPRPADDTGSAPGETGPRPIVRPDEEPLAEPGDESADADASTMAAVIFGTGEDSVAAAAEPFDVGLASVPGAYGEVSSGYGEATSGYGETTGDLSGGEADYRSGFRADDPSGERDADVWSSTVASPPAEHFQAANRLPIFEAVESDWFRQGGQATVRFGVPAGEASHGWSSPSDEGWRAAASAHAPSSGGVTSAGLPKRVPRANLVPGAAVGSEGGASAVVPTRSAAATRDRFSSFQRGSRRGRAAAEGEEDDVGGG